MDEYLQNLILSLDNLDLIENHTVQFYKFNGIFSKYFRKRLEEILKNSFCFNNVALDNLENNFCETISNLTIRTLILTFQDWQEKNKNVPKNIRYESFCLEICQKDFLNKIFEQYPVLLKKIFVRHQNTINLIRTSLDSIINDKDIIMNQMNFNVDSLSEIIFSDGDYHNNGKTSLIFSDGKNKLIYKPHSLANDHFLLEIFTEFNKYLPLALTHPNTVDRGNHGWQEFINYEYPQQDNDWQDYYFRYGELLFISYLLKMTDLHQENIVMTKNCPIIIDSETILFNNNFSWNHREASDLLKEFSGKVMTNTVLGTYLLPNNFFDIDFSPLSYEDQESSVMKQYVLENKNSYGIRLIQKNIKFNSAIKCEEFDKRLAGNFIIRGFMQAYKIFLEYKQCFIECIDNLLDANELVARQVLRPTFVYEKFLEASTHPEYLESDRKQQELFNKLRTDTYKKNSKLSIQIDVEVESLLNGDIPYFYTVSDSLDLYSNLHVIKSFYSIDLKGVLTNHFLKLGFDDLISECRMIKLSLSTKEMDRTPSLLEFFYKDDKSKPMTIVEGIADYICHEVNWDSSMKICTLATQMDMYNRVGISLLDYSFYNGGGVVFFLYALSLINDNNKYKEVAEGLLKGFEQQFMEQDDDYVVRDISAFRGVGSFIYINYLLYNLTKEERFYNRYLFFLKKVQLMDFKDINSIDFVGGVAGFIVLLSNIYDQEKDSRLLSLIKKYTDYCINNLDSITVTGLAHGYSGIVLGLAHSYNLIKDCRYLNIIDVLITKEDEYYNEQEKNWKDIRENSREKYPSYWCYGSGGIIAAREKAQRIISTVNGNVNQQVEFNEEILQDILGNMKDYCLCHGKFGFFNCLLSSITSNAAYSNRFVEKAEEEFDNQIKLFAINRLEVEDGEGLEKNNQDNFSFMTGLPGEAYEILRNQYCKLPNLLFLEV